MLETKKNTFSALLRVLCDLCGKTSLKPTVKFPDTISRRFFQLFTTFSPGIAQKYDISVILQDFYSPKPHLAIFNHVGFFYSARAINKSIG